MRLHPVVLSTDEVDRYYSGFSNSVLWPLFHGRLQPVRLERASWHSYQAVNQRFAATVANSAPLGGTVWIHDYHLLLAPALIRAMRPDLRVGLFLHIPFPSVRTFSMLPWRRQIIDSMLGADTLGFQVADDVENFVAVASRVTEAEVRGHTLSSRSHAVEVGAFPISIDFAAWEKLGGHAGARAHRHRLELGVQSIFLGVDRLDYTKGVSQRLQAFGELLDEGRLSSQTCAFVQVAVPTRSGIVAYQDERHDVEARVEAINARHRRPDGSGPVVYIDSSLNDSQLAGWYRAADALVVTSLADGMNLVAKEFVAARGDLGACLILSEFAGAAQDLDGALIVNPYDIEAIKRALVTSVRLPVVAKQARMRAMRAAVRANDVHDWARQFLGRLASAARPMPANVRGQVSVAST